MSNKPTRPTGASIREQVRIINAYRQGRAQTPTPRSNSGDVDARYREILERQRRKLGWRS